MEDDGPEPISIHSAFISEKKDLSKDQEQLSPNPWKSTVGKVYPKKK